MVDDLLVGTLSVTAFIVLIRKLLSFPSTKDIESSATKPLQQMGDDKAITIWGFEEAGDYPTYRLGNVDSPYVARVEAYLRLIGVPYKKMKSRGGSENPRHKVPFANIRGKMIDDSSRIIEHLQKTFSVKIDSELSKNQAATGHLIKQTLQGSLYWVTLHQMFDVQEGRDIFTAHKAAEFPPIVSTFIMRMILRGQRANLVGCGVGRLPHNEIVRKGQEDVRAISTVLGTNKFILGTPKPTSCDCDVYSFLVFLFYDDTQVVQPWVQEIKKECSNLVDYIERMKQLLYPELEKFDEREKVRPK
uniref:Thioredoxin-like fold domain-containing protein n=1 Tax=Helicotheca tamesis TaxID=374047 RepID=A0A7S2MJU1_9STRA|mmetsp:Transcript_17201/g.23645  ORF Transcript_17201/g.23645 Transcript_17201/m.23645 type:complete len:303 (+) Transcript_17201:65-973(+)|eukprot:CAMPEP_0185728998 /NCGR_PEP_ID=MMETSP1171-20130828/4411_1 /TAXON_ID=374046 /ORGANISM="Helicotheca tamensis, Strain CCMP826" /LENGTH=302 /DNA_ID=CAMNT_0028397761 /DNA_START=43 /DNA_END=951 /DNA_ORIENTATION=+